MREKPKSLEEAYALAESLAQEACDEAFRVFGERPHVERRTGYLVIVWPDGRQTHRIEVDYVH